MSAMFGYEIAPREYHNTSCREGENMYDRCKSQINNSLSSGYIVSGSGYFVFVGDGGDDSEGVDEADRGVDGLLVTVYRRGREGRGSVEEEGGIPLGQADSQALVQVPDPVRRLLFSVLCQG